MDIDKGKLLGVCCHNRRQPRASTDSNTTHLAGPNWMNTCSLRTKPFHWANTNIRLSRIIAAWISVERDWFESRPISKSQVSARVAQALFSGKTLDFLFRKKTRASAVAVDLSLPIWEMKWQDMTESADGRI